MAIELRKTAITVVGEVPWGTHFCFFYETAQDLLDTLVPYFKAGLESNEFCLWIISKSELITLEEAEEALRQALPDLEHYIAKGSIELHPSVLDDLGLAEAIRWQTRQFQGRTGIVCHCECFVENVDLNRGAINGCLSHLSGSSN